MSRKGFTLIELLLVVVVIGILVAIAIPKFSKAKEDAYVVAMKSDLRRLLVAEEAYFAGALTYSTDKTALDFQESTGVHVTIQYNAGKGWSADATHDATDRTCTLSIAPGNGKGIGVTEESVPTCT
jgi:prepilin-type N-terminal cleavage/methylation domain-containing protein